MCVYRAVYCPTLCFSSRAIQAAAEDAQDPDSRAAVTRAGKAVLLQ